MAKQISAPRLQPYRSGEPQRKPLTTGARSLHHAPPNMEGQTCVSARPVLRPHSSCLPLWGRCPSAHTLGRRGCVGGRTPSQSRFARQLPQRGSQGVRLSKSRRGRCPHRPGAQTWQVSTSSVSLREPASPQGEAPGEDSHVLGFADPVGADVLIGRDPGTLSVSLRSPAPPEGEPRRSRRPRKGFDSPKRRVRNGAPLFPLLTALI